MTDKCKLMTLQNQNISLDIEPIKNVFVFLGSLIPVSASELHRKITLASSAFGIEINRAIWSKTKISKKISKTVLSANTTNNNL